MSIENSPEKVMDFNERLLASTPRWNAIGEYRRGVVLASNRRSGEQQKFYLGLKQFRLLQVIISAGMSHKEYTVVQNDSTQTIKSKASLIYRKFDIGPGSDKSKKIQLIARLINLGVLTFEPRIPEKDWLGIRESNP